MQNDIENRFHDLGYSKPINRLSDFSNKAVHNEDFTEARINHTILNSAHVCKSIFDRAAVTGSIFEGCKFIDCSMEDPDFEYCKFLNCDLISSKQKRFTSSLNNSNFIKTYFKNIDFYACSFAECYFEQCDFDNIKIEYSTLDNALFTNCTFWNVDFRNLNFNFAEFENPHFINSKLFVPQIPYIIGGLQYCKNTDDYVEIISKSGKSYTKEEYLSDVLPLLIEEYTNDKEYFPLANIYMSLQETNKAIETIKNGLNSAITLRDFRMIKFYCKLIAKAAIFNTHELHDLYHHICRLIPQGNNNNPELHSFIRNIGEIKNILYSSSKRPSMHISFITNLRSYDTEKIAVLVGKIFQLAKMKYLNRENQAEMKLSENSPILIELEVGGSKESINMLLVALISLTLNLEENMELPLLEKNAVSQLEKNAELFLQTRELKKQCQNLGIIITLEEYSVQNCDITLLDDKNTYYYNGNLNKADHWLNSFG